MGRGCYKISQRRREHGVRNYSNLFSILAACEFPYCVPPISNFSALSIFRTDTQACSSSLLSHNLTGHAHSFFFQNPVAFLSSCVLCPHLLKFFGVVVLTVLSCYNWKTLTTIWSSSSPLEVNKPNATEVKLNHTRPTSKL